MKEEEVSISFNQSFIRERVTLPSADGGSYELYIIEMPDEEGDKHEIKRTFTVPASRLHTDRKYDYIKFVYLLKDKNYRVMRALYDSDYRARRVESDFHMTGQEIADVFQRYRDRKKKKLEKDLNADPAGEKE